MRELTLDEKISINGVFEQKGISEVPNLTMKHAMTLFSSCFMWESIANWAKYQKPRLVKHYNPNITKSRSWY